MCLPVLLWRSPKQILKEGWDPKMVNQRRKLHLVPFGGLLLLIPKPFTEPAEHVRHLRGQQDESDTRAAPREVTVQEDRSSRRGELG